MSAPCSASLCEAIGGDGESGGGCGGGAAGSAAEVLRQQRLSHRTIEHVGGHPLHGMQSRRKTFAVIESLQEAGVQINKDNYDPDAEAEEADAMMEALLGDDGDE